MIAQKDHPLGIMNIRTEFQSQTNRATDTHIAIPIPNATPPAGLIKTQAAALVEACCFRYWWDDEIWSRKTRVGNISMSLKAHQVPKLCTVVYNMMKQHLNTSGTLSRYPASQHRLINSLNITDMIGQHALPNDFPMNKLLYKMKAESLKALFQHTHPWLSLSPPKNNDNKTSWPPTFMQPGFHFPQCTPLLPSHAMPSGAPAAPSLTPPWSPATYALSSLQFDIGDTATGS